MAASKKTGETVTASKTGKKATKAIADQGKKPSGDVDDAEPVAKPAAAKAARKASAATPTKVAKVSVRPGKKKAAVTEDLAADVDADDADNEPVRKPKPGSALVVVESPAKAKTIKKYLGAGYVVKASVGHVKDLPKTSMGIDIDKGFTPRYEVIEGKRKVLSEIVSAARKVERILLAPDPDREGEAIAWHIAEEIRPANSNISRVLFNEITKKAITLAITKPMALDEKKFESQQARRILDRLVGYEISPVLWTKVKRGLSAGRVQSVAVRLVCEREAEVKAFRPEEYWTIDVTVDAAMADPIGAGDTVASSARAFAARLHRVDGEKPVLVHEGQAREIDEAIKAATLKVTAVERKERKKNPPPPFITSKLQQEAASKLRFSPKRTMGLAQRLYEGFELGEEGPVGLITYMRTDSTRVSDDALAEVRAHIALRYGAASVPAQPNVFKSKKSAQDAHEAIRPTSTKYDPESIRRIVAESGGGGRDPRETEDLLKLYTLIWNRFVGCQMVPAVFDQTTIDIDAGRAALRASGQVIKVAGFLEVYAESVEDAQNEDESTGNLPDIKEGELLRLVETRPEQHFTQPPPRFSEATLVKELEEKGIGRPSTYATILSTVQDRGYVEKKEGRLFPTELGVMVNGLLVKSFPDIVSSDFTAQMEERLDQVEEGSVDWVKLLKDFYVPFKADLARAKIEMRDVKREETPTEHNCEKCGKNMVIKWGRNGHFLACTGYPECRNTKEYRRAEDGTITVVSSTRETNEKCPTCTSPMVIRRGRFGEFMACSRYPDCKTTSPISIGVTCPKPDCGGYVTEKRSRRGKVFYGCANYSKTKCDFVSWDKPVNSPCPQCGAAFLVLKVSKAGVRRRCVAEGCGYSIDEEEPGAVPPQSPPVPDAKAS